MEEDKEFSLFSKKILELLEKFGEIEIHDVELTAEELTLMLQPTMVTSASTPQMLKPVEKRVEDLLKAEFTPPAESFPGQVVEVQIGAMKSEGGSRGRVVKVGGAKTMPFYSFEFQNPNPPAFAMDVFDMPLKLAKPIRQHLEDVKEDPAEWAKKCIEKFGADIVSLNLISTDPLIKDTPAREAAKVVERVLQAVDAPLIVGGSGNKEKDPVVLEAVAEVAQGERVVLNSACMDNDHKRIVEAAKKYGHSVVSFTPMDVNNQKRLNRILIDEGLPREQLIQDPTTGALGYGLEYTFSIMERIKLNGLMGDEDLQMPTLAAASNAWGAREAWMKTPEWGPREYRGPLWETITCLSVMMAGADLFMISHPATVRVVKGLVEHLYGRVESDQRIEGWVTMER